MSRETDDKLSREPQTNAAADTGIDISGVKVPRVILWTSRSVPEGRVLSDEAVQTVYQAFEWASRRRKASSQGG